ncbi:cysteine peptidase family C39 domain-containing protein, partial [Paracidovorax anthurii]|uniref:cysteine peptidase family C39 domain-containing protein n=1 Tax=Paracidovorax anthurii TaxID=78229 RepID=UPI001FE728CE
MASAPEEANHAALQALCLIARLHQVAAEPATLAHQLGLSASDAVGVQDLLLAARLLGLKARRVRSGAERLTLAPLPALALVRAPGAAGGEDGGDEGAGGAGLHAVVLAQCDGQRVLLQDPGAAGAESGGSGGGRPTIESVPEFTRRWTGELILVSSRASLAGELARFDFSWFIPSLVRHRRLLGEVLLISFMLQLFALVSPLFFQVVMDKVLVHRGLTTLDVLVAGLVVVVVFESVLN